MLIQFNFKNFKSFKDEISLNLSSAKILERQKHTDHVVNIADEKLLKVSAIYGANGSGKSNVCEAFKFMTQYVLNSFNFGGDNSKKKQYRNNEDLKVTPFLFDKISRDRESTFEVFFIDDTDIDKISYQYGFSIFQNEILEEWLYSTSKTSKEYNLVFYREKVKEIEFSKIPKSSRENIITSLEKETLIISLASKLKIVELKSVWNWFSNNKILDFDILLKDTNKLNTEVENLKTDKKNQEDLIYFLSSFDNTIQGIKFNDEYHPQIKNKKNAISISHKCIDNYQDGIFFPLQNESKGIRKMFDLFFYFKEVFRYGGTLFIDDFDMNIHPLVVRDIVSTFLDPEINIKNAQLIFTTHDVWQLSNNLLRKDEIWFTEKNNNSISSLFSLAEFKDDTCLKNNVLQNYLTGRYGAIPELELSYASKEDTKEDTETEEKIKLINLFIAKIKEKYTNIEIKYNFDIDDDEYYIYHNNFDLERNYRFEDFAGRLMKEIFRENGFLNCNFSYDYDFDMRCKDEIVSKIIQS